MSSIYVCNLNYSVDSETLKAAFEPYGTVTSAKVISDRETGRSRGFGFVEMDDKDAETAIEKLNGAEVAGRVIRVSAANPRKERPARNDNWNKDNY